MVLPQLHYLIQGCQAFTHMQSLSLCAAAGWEDERLDHLKRPYVIASQADQALLSCTITSTDMLLTCWRCTHHDMCAQEVLAQPVSLCMLHYTVSHMVSSQAPTTMALEERASPI